jgi:hypothetical protein
VDQGIHTAANGGFASSLFLTGKASTMHVIRWNPVESSERFMMQNQQLPVTYIGFQSE